MFLYKSLLFLFTFIIFGNSFAQQTAIDSIKKSLPELDGQDKVDALLDLSQLSGNNSADRKKYAEEAVEISKQLNYPFGIIEGLANIGYSYYNAKDYKPAVNYFSIAYNDAKDENLKHLIAVNSHRLGISYQKLAINDSAKFYFKKAISIWINDSQDHELDLYFSANNLGLLYWRTAVYDSAITYYRIAKRMTERINDKKREAAINNNIGIIYWQWGIYDQAIEYYSNSLNARQELKDSAGVAKMYNNLGLAYLEHGNKLEAKKYFEQGLEISKLIHNDAIKGYSLNNLGRIYLELGDFNESLKFYQLSLKAYENLDSDEGKILNYNDIALALNGLNRPDEALSYTHRAMQISIRKQFRQYIGISYRNFGESYILLNQFSEGITNLDSAVSVAKETKAAVLLRDSYKSLSHAYQKKNDMANYAKYLNLYYETKEKILTEKSSNRLLEFQTRIETLESQRLLKEKEFQLEHTAIQLYYAYGIVFLMLIVIFIIYRMNRAKRIINETLNKNNEQLDSLNATKDKILSVIAHDLKNPMGNVLNYAEFLVYDYDDMNDSERISIAQGIHISILSVFDLLNNLLTWARNQRGLIEIEKESFDVSQVIEKVHKRTQLLFNEKLLTCSIIVDKKTITSDKFIIETVLTNLVNNAVKFTPVNGKIEIFGKVLNDQYSISVKDSGIGMTADKISTIFNIQTSTETKGTNSEKGTGLGLIICKELIDKIGGTISVESKVGEGSTFTITIPQT